MFQKRNFQSQLQGWRWLQYYLTPKDFEAGWTVISDLGKKQMHLPKLARGSTLNKNMSNAKIVEYYILISRIIYQSLAFELEVNAGAACFVTTTCDKGGPLNEDPLEFPLRSA